MPRTDTAITSAEKSFAAAMANIARMEGEYMDATADILHRETKLGQKVESDFVQSPILSERHLQQVQWSR
jgi:hypothetical protein